MPRAAGECRPRTNHYSQPIEASFSCADFTSLRTPVHHAVINLSPFSDRSHTPSCQRFGIFPVVPVENRVKTNSLDGRAVHPGLENLVGDFADPPRPPRTEMAGLGDEQRTMVAPVNLRQHPVQRHPPVIARRLFPTQPSGGMFPLVGMVDNFTPIMSRYLGSPPSSGYRRRTIISQASNCAFAITGPLSAANSGGGCGAEPRARWARGIRNARGDPPTGSRHRLASVAA